MRILKGLSSRVLPCGCVVGIYETYDAQTVAILDVPAALCATHADQGGNVVPVEWSRSSVDSPGPQP